MTNQVFTGLTENEILARNNAVFTPFLAANPPKAGETIPLPAHLQNGWMSIPTTTK